MAATPPISLLVIDELFSSQDESFVPSLRRVVDLKAMAAFADRWNRDPRPWAREQKLLYLEGPLGFATDAPLIKRLYKHAETNRDHQLVAAFMTAFDCAVRRTRGKRWRWDRVSGTSWDEEVLELPGRRRRPPGMRFSYHTLYYLRRRAWRYFRRMGFQQPTEYPAAVASGLIRYRDDDLAKGENILDSWGLVHALFGKHPALRLGASHVNLAPGRDLSELIPAPYFLEAWQRSEAISVLFDLIGKARSRVVRVWAIGMIRRQHGRKLPGLDVTALVPLFEHSDEEVQQFAAELLEHLPDLAEVSLDIWTQLLRVRSLTALSTIIAVADRLEVGKKLSLTQKVDLALERSLPLARWGWQLLQPLQLRREEFPQIARLSEARASSLAGEMTTWALGKLEESYDVDLVVQFFDSLLKETRDAAWAWLTPTAPGWNDPSLWARLLETPYDDVRHRLVLALQQRTKLPGATSTHLAALWCGVLLNIHRGGRHKLTALRQISGALRADPASAETLLPIVAVAMRSVRVPEARAGIAAIVAALDARPQLLPSVARYLPELQLLSEGAAA